MSGTGRPAIGSKKTEAPVIEQAPEYTQEEFENGYKITMTGTPDEYEAFISTPKGKAMSEEFSARAHQQAEASKSALRQRVNKALDTTIGTVVVVAAISTVVVVGGYLVQMGVRSGLKNRKERNAAEAVAAYEASQNSVLDDA